MPGHKIFQEAERELLLELYHAEKTVMLAQVTFHQKFAAPLPASSSPSAMQQRAVFLLHQNISSLW